MTAPATAVETVGLTKVFGSHRALGPLDLAVPAGSVFGLLGPNGAGKTTLIRILLGLARASAGTATVLGERLEAGPRARRGVGYLPDVPGYHPWMRADEFLRFVASLFGLDRRTTAERVGALLDMAGLAGVDAPIGGYSRGMKQRLGVAQALVNAPELLILDEPTSALDPAGRRDVLDMIDRLRGRTTVVFSTHILTDAERTCDHVAVLDRGRLLTATTMAELTARHGGGDAVRVAVDDPGPLEDALTREPWVTGVVGDDDGALVLTVTDPRAAAVRVPELVARHHLALHRLEPVERSLEDVFLSLIGQSR